jgi:hypothetical protein
LGLIIKVQKEEIGEKEVEKIKVICTINNITVEKVKEISENIKAGDQFKAEGEEILSVKAIISGSLQRSDKVRIAKLKEKSKLRKHRKVRERAEAKRKILEQEHNLQVEKVKSKKSPDLNQ